MKKTIFTPPPPNRALKQSSSLVIFALAAIIAFTFFACSEDEPGGTVVTENTEPKTVVITGVEADLNDFMLGVFSTSKSDNEIIAAFLADNNLYPGLVAGSQKEYNSLPIGSQEETTLTLPLFSDPFGTPAVYKGNGGFNLWLKVTKGGTTKFYKNKTAVSITTAKTTVALDRFDDKTAAVAEAKEIAEATESILDALNSDDRSVIDGDLLKAAKLVSESATTDEIAAYKDALENAYTEVVLDSGDNWDTLLAALLEGESIDDLWSDLVEGFSLMSLDTLIDNVNGWLTKQEAYAAILEELEGDAEVTEEMFTAAGFSKIGAIDDFETFLEAFLEAWEEVIDGNYWDFYMTAYVVNNTPVDGDGGGDPAP